MTYIDTVAKRVKVQYPNLSCLARPCGLIPRQYLLWISSLVLQCEGSYTPFTVSSPALRAYTQAISSLDFEPCHLWRGVVKRVKTNNRDLWIDFDEVVGESVPLVLLRTIELLVGKGDVYLWSPCAL